MIDAHSTGGRTRLASLTPWRGLLLGAFALAASGCGGSGGGPDAATTRTAAAPAESSPAAPIGAAPAAASGDGPSITFTSLTYDFGQIWDVENRGAFEFTSSGDEPLIMKVVKGRCSCTTATTAKNVYEPGERGRVEVVFDPTGPGPQDKQIDVITNAPEPVVLTLRANVRRFVQYAPDLLRFDVVELGREHRRTIRVSSPDPKLEIESVRAVVQSAVPPFEEVGRSITARIVPPVYPAPPGHETLPPGHYDIEVVIDPTVPWGTLYGGVYVTWKGTLNPGEAPTSHTERVAVNASIFGSLRASEQRFSAGLLSPGAPINSTVRLTHAQGKPFSVTSVRVSQSSIAGLTARAVPVRDPGTSGYDIVVAGNVGAYTGPVNGIVEIATDVPGEELLTLRISGVAK
jgi:hypothetical protein